MTHYMWYSTPLYSNNDLRLCQKFGYEFLTFPNFSNFPFSPTGQTGEGAKDAGNPSLKSMGKWENGEKGKNEPDVPNEARIETPTNHCPVCKEYLFSQELLFNHVLTHPLKDRKCPFCFFNTFHYLHPSIGAV